MRKLLFENETCTRCGGTGHYSWCATHGTRCFKCGGDGATLTKRGRAAQYYLDASRRVPLAALKVGDEYLSEGFSCGAFRVSSEWVTVTAVTTLPPVAVVNDGISSSVQRVSVSGVTAKGDTSGYEGNADTTVRLRRTVEADRALKDAALAYQSALTKSGKPMKRRTKTVA